MKHGAIRQTQLRRPTGYAAIGLVVGIGLLAGCGSDDDESAQDTYCEAGQALESSVTALANLDLVAGGTDALESALETVKDAANDLGDSATDAAADEVSALEESVEGLDDAISDLGGDISTENASTVATAVGNVATSAQAVYGTLADCP